MDVNIDPSWKAVLAAEFDKPYFHRLASFVRNEYLTKRVFPHPKDVFAAFRETPFSSVRVVILGQDPYHGEGQAHGLSFSVREGMRNPPSLQNIFKELAADLGTDTHEPMNALTHERMNSGDLTRWARQGVLLLNATLTVQANQPGSHQQKGWEEFTDAVIRVLSDQREHLVFILWGAYAQKKGLHIDTRKHLVLRAPHPSPFSAHSGFFGSKPFSQANAYLAAHGQQAIRW